MKSDYVIFVKISADVSLLDITTAKKTNVMLNNGS